MPSEGLRRRCHAEFTAQQGRPSRLQRHVGAAPFRLGVTAVRLRADVANRAGTLRQPTLGGSFGSLQQPRIVKYEASNYENADSEYGEGDRLDGDFFPRLWPQPV